MKSFLFAIILSIPGWIFAQKVYMPGDPVADFPFGKTINNPSGYDHFGALPAGIIILDFFGTWCIPCVRALPHLAGLQEKYKGRLHILLISNEQPARLEKFISTRQPFPFLVVADERNSITGLFAPPSYPYTVVISKERKIIALTDAAGITEKLIDDWLNGTGDPVIRPEAPKPNAVTTINLASSNQLVALSQELMYAAKTGDSTTAFVQTLARMNYADLKNQLGSDDEKKAFWINLYNGFTQVLLKQNPDLYKNRGSFFRSKRIMIAGIRFSLDDLEHGILRRSKIKWSLGHLNKLFPGKTEKELRVDEPDYRVHFALNCGARSCPPIAFYNPENLNPQLEQATYAYLQSEAGYDASANRIHLPAIMGWFRRDFGGKKGMIELLRNKKIIPPDARPKIRFKPYDWSLYTGNYNN